jgi:hypothetical protein
VLDKYYLDASTVEVVQSMSEVVPASGCLPQKHLFGNPLIAYDINHLPSCLDDFKRAVVTFTSA